MDAHACWFHLGMNGLLCYHIHYGIVPFSWILLYAFMMLNHCASLSFVPLNADWGGCPWWPRTYIAPLLWSTIATTAVSRHVVHGWTMFYKVQKVNVCPMCFDILTPPTRCTEYVYIIMIITASLKSIQYSRGGGGGGGGGGVHCLDGSSPAFLSLHPFNAYVKGMQKVCLHSRLLPLINYNYMHSGWAKQFAGQLR